MDREAIRAKFGADYSANDLTYRMGLDVRFADHIADRFKGRVVLETCTGGGFTTIALAKRAAHVFSVEIDLERQREAKRNAAIAEVGDNITFIRSDIFDLKIDSLAKRIDAALIDPDWADAGADHVYRFVDSTTRPPSDWILEYLGDYTENITYGWESRTILSPLRATDKDDWQHGLPHLASKRKIQRILECSLSEVPLKLTGAD